MTEIPSNGRAFAVIAMETLREAVRRRAGQGLLWVGAVFILLGIFFAEIDFGTDPVRFGVHFGFGVIYLFGTGAAILLPALILQAAIESRGHWMILARPVRAGVYVTGLWGGVAVALLGFTATLGLLLGGLLWFLWPVVPDLPPGMEGPSGVDFSAAGFLVQLGLQGLRLVFVAALSLFFAVLFRALAPALAVTLLVVLIGEMRGAAEAVHAQGGSGIGRVFGLLFRVLPDFAGFHASERVFGGAMDGGDLALLLGHALLYGGAVLIFAGVLFGKRKAGGR